MANEAQITLEPAEIAELGRTELLLNAGGLTVAAEGIEFGEQSVQPFEIQGTFGEQMIDYRLQNRIAKIPLIVRRADGVSFDDWRVKLQAAVSTINTKGGGWMKRTFASGRHFFAQVQSAKLRLTSDWMTENRLIDRTATLELSLIPPFFGPELTGKLHESVTGDLEFTEEVEGDLPGLVTKLEVIEGSGNNQLGLAWHLRGRNYSSAETAAWAYNAEKLELLDASELEVTAGSYGEKVVIHPSLATSWTPILSTTLKTGSYLTHRGVYTVLARVFCASETMPWLRLVWDVGDIIKPTENQQVQIPGQSYEGRGEWYIVNLGTVNLQTMPFGEQRWRGVLQGRGEKGGEKPRIDRLWFLCADEYSGILSAPLGTVNAASPFVAHDAFNQAAGNLEGKTLPTGGTWAEEGKVGAEGFIINSSAAVAERAKKSDASVAAGSYAIAGTSEHTSIRTSVIVASTALAEGMRFGTFARYKNTKNWVMAAFQFKAGSGVVLQVIKCIEGTTGTVIGETAVSWGAKNTVELQVNSDGTWLATFSRDGGAAPAQISGIDSDLGSAGALKTGKVGIYDAWSAASAATRTYDSFGAWAPEQDAVIFSKRSAYLTSRGNYRQSEDGKASGPMANPGADLPRLPTGLTEIALKASRGVIGENPDSGRDKVSAQLTYRPAWSNIPNAVEGEAWSSSLA